MVGRDGASDGTGVTRAARLWKLLLYVPRSKLGGEPDVVPAPEDAVHIVVVAPEALACSPPVSRNSAIRRRYKLVLNFAPWAARRLPGQHAGASVDLRRDRPGDVPAYGAPGEVSRTVARSGGRGRLLRLAIESWMGDRKVRQ
jgi:hypothetical protein